MHRPSTRGIYNIRGHPRGECGNMLNIRFQVSVFRPAASSLLRSNLGGTTSMQSTDLPSKSLTYPLILSLLPINLVLLEFALGPFLACSNVSTTSYGDKCSNLSISSIPWYYKLTFRVHRECNFEPTIIFINASCP